MRNSFFIKRRGLSSVVSVLLILLIWKLLTIRINTDIILPPPERVFVRLFSVFASDEFLLTVAKTCLRTLYGILISFVLGFFIGIACGISGIFNSIMSPVLSVTRSTPVMSVILLAMIWLKTENVPVFVCILMVFPIITTNVRQGVLGVDNSLLEIGKIYNLSQKSIVFNIIIPSVIPFVFAALYSSIGVAWKVVIAAEVLAQPIGAIGTNLQFSQMNLETAEVIAWTVVAVLLSGLSEFGFSALLRNKKWSFYGEL